MAKKPPSRISGQKILDDLRLAARKGDRAALTLALDQMRTLAHSPKYWEKYLALLRNPLARLVDMLLIKQGERIAHQKGWKLPKVASPAEKPRKPATRAAKTRAARARAAAAASALQISLFE
jgi:mannitol-1-phosphate/altronate dehydrogenase